MIEEAVSPAKVIHALYHHQDQEDGWSVTISGRGKLLINGAPSKQPYEWAELIELPMLSGVLKSTAIDGSLIFKFAIAGTEDVIRLVKEKGGEVFWDCPEK